MHDVIHLFQRTTTIDLVVINNFMSLLKILRNSCSRLSSSHRVGHASRASVAWVTWFTSDPIDWTSRSIITLLRLTEFSEFRLVGPRFPDVFVAWCQLKISRHHCAHILVFDVAS